MFGIRFIKLDPTMYVFQYSGGALKRQGAGLSFFYFAPITSLVAVPVASAAVPFIFKEVTMDFQETTVQGEVAYRVADPARLAAMLNYTLDGRKMRYVSEDPEMLPQRVVNQVQVLVKDTLRTMALQEALKSTDLLAANVGAALRKSGFIESYGLEILDLSLLAVKPVPETARALEAGVREQLLKEADEAIYDRRNSAVEQERAIRENELNTEIAVENKKRQIRESQMDAEIAVEEKRREKREKQMEAERAVQKKKRLLDEERMAADITLEDNRKELVALAAQNTRDEADAKAYSLRAVMDVVANIEPKVLNALASKGMDPSQLIALSFRELAESAAKIGELNISPDLLRELTRKAEV